MKKTTNPAYNQVPKVPKGSLDTFGTLCFSENPKKLGVVYG